MAMDNFIIVTQKGHSEESLKSRQLVRAHAARKHWEALKGHSDPHVPWTRPKSKSPPKAALRFPSRQSRSEKADTTAKAAAALPDQAYAGPRTIGRASDVFVYAGSYLDPESYGFFQHYGAEFKVVLCNGIQPFYVDGPAVCCTTAVQMNSSALLHAISYQAAAHEAAASASAPLRPSMFQDPGSTHGLERDALYHKAKALSGLRSLVENYDAAQIATESSVLCVAVLLAAEAIMGDDVSLKSHASGLRHLVGVRGGLEALSAPAASVVRLADVKAALVRRTRPHFGGPSLAVGLLESHARSKKTAGTLQTLPTDQTGSGFLEKRLRSRLRPAVLACASEVRRLTLAVSRANRRRRIVGVALDDFIALEYNLASLRNDDLTALERSVCLALLLFVNTALWRVPVFFNWVKCLTADFEAAIRQLDWSVAVDRHPGLLLWMMFMGRYVGCLGPAADCHWWSERIRHAAARAGVATFQAARVKLQEFFYVEEVYGHAWERIWEDAACGRLLGSEADEVAPGLASLVVQEHPCDH